MATEQSRALLGHTLRELTAPGAATPLWVLRTRMAALQTVLQVTDLAMKACGGAAFRVTSRSSASSEMPALGG